VVSKSVKERPAGENESRGIIALLIRAGIFIKDLMNEWFLELILR
jgi:hypothetical protein